MRQMTIKRVIAAGLAAGLAGGWASAATLVYSFEGGLLADGFKDLQAPGSRTTWESTDALIDIGDGFNLLAASAGDSRVVVTPFADRDNFGNAEDYTMVLRSPAFTLDGSGDLSVDMIGGTKIGEDLDPGLEPDPAHVGELGSYQRNLNYDFAAAGQVDDGIHVQGFALRDALTGEYVLVGYSDANNDGKMRVSDPPDRGVWDTVTFTAAQLAPYANDGRAYQVDLFDAFGSGSWAWIGFDNIRVPGVAATLLLGDTDGDTDIDDFDLLAAISSFTGSGATSPVAKPGGLAADNGDTDDDGDVDDFDLLSMISGFTGSLSAENLTAPAVPEPGALALLALGGAMLARRRRG